MALLVAPLAAAADEPWLRALAGEAGGLAYHLLRARGAEGTLGQGIEDLLRVVDRPGCAWVALVVGTAESVAYALDVVGAQPTGDGKRAERAALVLGGVGQAQALAVDSCGGSRHSLVLAQCDSAQAGEVLRALADERAGAGLAGARFVLLRDAWRRWAVAGVRAGSAPALARVGSPQPPTRLAEAPGTGQRGAGPARHRYRLPGAARPESLRPASDTTALDITASDSTAWDITASDSIASEHGPPFAGPALPRPTGQSPSPLEYLTRGLSSRLRPRVPSRLTGAVAALSIAAIAAGSAGWVIVHRGTGASSGPAAPQLDTAVATGPTPSARTAAMSAVWDRTAQVILFGGAAAGSGHGVPLGDTWRGALPPSAAWSRVEAATQQPSPRLGGAMAADLTDGYVLLFGGEAAGDIGLMDTWSYGGTWSALTPNNRPPPGPALAATEPTTGRVLLVTACCALAAVPTDERMQTWRWTGSTWAQLGPAPGWVSTAALVGDAWNGTVVMLADDGAGLGVTYIWDGTAWSQHHGVMEPPLVAGAHPRLSYDPRTRMVLDVVTGRDGTQSTWTWDGSVWREQELSGGPPVVGLVLPEPLDGRAVIYGGVSETDDLTQRWFWTGTGWTEPPYPPAVAQLPTAGFGAAVAADPGTGGLIAFGGSDAFDQTWIWTGQSWSQAFFTTPAPPPRFGASIAWDPVNSIAVMFGGRLQDGALATDMWLWRGHEWSQEAVTGMPPPTENAPMAYDEVRREMVLLVPSGSDAPATMDTWTWDGRAWTQRSGSSGPPARAGSSLAWDPASGSMLLTLPCCVGAPQQQSETWAWDGRAWQRLQTLHSPPMHAVVAPDAKHSRTVLVAACCGGFDSGDSVGPPTTWTWNGTDWTRSAAALPALQDVSALATDVRGDVLLVARVAGAGPRHPVDGLWRWTGTDWERLV
jgi:hypothetical protein